MGVTNLKNTPAVTQSPLSYIIEEALLSYGVATEMVDVASESVAQPLNAAILMKLRSVKAAMFREMLSSFCKPSKQLKQVLEDPPPPSTQVYHYQYMDCHSDVNVLFCCIDLFLCLHTGDSRSVCRFSVHTSLP